LEISSPSTSMTTARKSDTRGSASSSAVRNWLETSPRTRIGVSVRTLPEPAVRRSGGKPSLPR
jgi:hypothetical protein